MPVCTDTHVARSSTPFRFGNDPQRRRTERFPVIGKATYLPRTQHLCAHAGGAAFALLHVEEGGWQGHGHGGGCSEPARTPTASELATFADLGSWTGDGAT